MSDMHRRDFLKTTTAAGLGVIAASGSLAPLAPFAGRRRSPGAP